LIKEMSHNEKVII